MPLSSPQRKVLEYLCIGGWCSGDEVVEWTGMSGRTTRHSLMALLRKGLVVHSDHTSDTWRSTPRAWKVLMGSDGRMAR